MNHHPVILYAVARQRMAEAWERAESHPVESHKTAPSRRRYVGGEVVARADTAGQGSFYRQDTVWSREAPCELTGGVL